ncbi:hypothetical protein BN874_100024 [Candidatus Contendobacter odensis Run_B_J11]|uniref:Uncharacterized protein n=1 Tax=Candidatus Contendobacter odensis Run_B_J11 TaxID=1400861 RepID=A0A7U7J1R2_9GAMM|nr:hypothetical protein BN874_100024 [Candidatus Contendobacter odensis Run_B_J11]
MLHRTPMVMEPASGLGIKYLGYPSTIRLIWKLPRREYRILKGGFHQICTLYATVLRLLHVLVEAGQLVMLLNQQGQNIFP